MPTPPRSKAPSSSVATSSSLHLAVLLASQVAVGSAALMARGGLNSGIGPVSLAFWRLLVAALVLVLVLRARGKNVAHFGRRNALRAVFAGICLGWHFATWFISLQFVSVALSTLLVASSPLWAGLIEWIWHKKPPKLIFWIGLALATAGVYGVAMGEGIGEGKNLLLGCVMATLGAILVVFYLLLGRPLQHRFGTWRTVAWVYGAAALCLLPILPLLEAPNQLIPENIEAWSAVIGMALVPQLLGHTALNWSMRWFSASIVGLTTLLEPVIAALLAWPIFGEAVNWHQGIGAVVLLAGIVLGLQGSRAKKVPDLAQ